MSLAYFNSPLSKWFLNLKCCMKFFNLEIKGGQGEARQLEEGVVGLGRILIICLF